MRPVHGQWTWEKIVPNHAFKFARLALVAFFGALIFEIITTFAVGVRESFTVRQIPAHLAALLVGALAGWLFELLRESTIATAETLRVADTLTTKLHIKMKHLICW